MINIKILLLLPILFIFIPAFAFYVPFLKASYMFFYVFIYFALIILSLIKFKSLTNKMIKYYKYTPFKYFIAMMCAIVIASIIQSFCGVTNFGLSIRSIIIKICLGCLPIYIFFLYIIDSCISYKKFIKMFLTLFYIMLILGFVFFISHVFNITIINNIFDFFNNARALSASGYSTSESYSMGSGGMVRLYGLFQEPSLCARFLFVFLPFIYTIALSKIKIYNNKYLNFLIKKTLIPFTLLNLILTMSPMFLIFTGIVSLFYFKNQIFYLIKKYQIFIISILLLMTFIILKFDFSNTYLSRIINVVTQVSSFEAFNVIEPSLATRIENYINSWCLFIKHPILGIGIGNLPYLVLTQYQYSPVPLSGYIKSRILDAVSTHSPVPFDYGYLYSFLAEYGIIPFGFLVVFYIKLIYFLKKYIHLKSNIIDSDVVIAKGLYASLMGSLILLFYDLEFLKSVELHLIFILILAFIYRFKVNRINSGRNL